MNKYIRSLACFLFVLGLSMPAFAEPLASTMAGEKGNIEVSVTGAKVVDNVLTVTLSLVNQGKTFRDGASVRFFADEAFVMSGGRKYSLMKDLTNGEYLASPETGISRGDPGDSSSYVKQYGVLLSGAERGVIWMKFPAPATNNVELMMPNMAPLSFQVTR